MLSRTLVEPWVAALVAFAVHRLAAVGPLRTTLIAVPLVVVALRAIGRWAEARGCRSSQLRSSTFERVALGLLTAAGLTHPKLGVEGSAVVVASGLIALLLWRAGRMLLGLRPLLGRRLPERPAAVFFWLPFVVYAALVPWTSEQRQPSGDEPYYLLLTHSLAYDLDARLANNYADEDWRRFTDRRVRPQPGDPVGPDGEIYSRHNLTLPLVLAPAYRLLGRAGAQLILAALAALLAWQTLRLARHYTPDRPGEGLVAYGIASLAPPLVIFSGQVWVEVPAALLTALALDRLCVFSRSRARGDLAALGLLAVALVALKLRFALIAVPLALIAWWRSGRSPKLLFGSLATLASALAGVAIYNQTVYGNPLKIYRWAEISGLHRNPPIDFVKGALGLFFDCGFGLFAVSPIWALLLAAVPHLLLTQRRILTDLVALFFPYWLVLIPRSEWYGGFSPPFRYGLVALPLLTIALVPLLRHRRRGGARLLVAVLAAATALLTVCWLAVPGWAYNLADGRNHLLDLLSLEIGADVARFFPSFVRPRLASWLWPIAALVAINGLWWLRRPRVAAAPTAASLLLALSALLPWSAIHLPTAVIEVEDLWVRSEGGTLFPSKWQPTSVLYRRGLVLGTGDSLEAPLIVGGRRAEIEIELQPLAGPSAQIEVAVDAAGRRIGTRRLGARQHWATLTLDAADWPDALAEPRLTLYVSGRQPVRRAVLIDRIRIRWR